MEHRVTNSVFNLKAPLPGAVPPGVTVHTPSVSWLMVRPTKEGTWKPHHTSEGDFIWKPGLCELNQVEMRAWGTGVLSEGLRV